MLLALMCKVSLYRSLVDEPELLYVLALISFKVPMSNTIRLMSSQSLYKYIPNQYN